MTAELHHPVTGLNQELHRDGEHNADIVGVVEAFTRHAEHTLLRHHLLHKFQIIVETWEPGHIHSNHHVHSTLENTVENVEHF